MRGPEHLSEGMVDVRPFIDGRQGRRSGEGERGTRRGAANPQSKFLETASGEAEAVEPLLSLDHGLGVDQRDLGHVAALAANRAVLCDIVAHLEGALCLLAARGALLYGVDVELGLALALLLGLRRGGGAHPTARLPVSCRCRLGGPCLLPSSAP